MSIAHLIYIFYCVVLLIALPVIPQDDRCFLKYGTFQLSAEGKFRILETSKEKVVDCGSIVDLDDKSQLITP